MAGWALLAGLAAISLLALWRLKFPLALRSFALAATMLGAAGYAWQGRPAMAGNPVHGQPVDTAIDDETIGLRNTMFGRYGASAAYLTPADALMRFGSPAAAAQMLQGGINREPGSVVLWTQLGTVIAERDGAVSPAALFSFRRAIWLGKVEPAPWFFLGLAQLKGGDFSNARASWARALALTPASFPYRRDIAARLALLDLYLAQQ